MERKKDDEENDFVVPDDEVEVVREDFNNNFGTDSE